MKWQPVSLLNAALIYGDALIANNAIITQSLGIIILIGTDVSLPFRDPLSRIRAEVSNLLSE
jgi:hypothetical protein